MCVCLAEENQLQQCRCGPTEIQLRCWQAEVPGPKMTAEQRAWCKDQVQDIEGGDWPGNDATDALVAGAVLDAWRTFARDKGTY